MCREPRLKRVPSWLPRRFFGIAPTLPQAGPGGERVGVLGTNADRDPVRDLEAYLVGEYRAGVPWRLTVRPTTATGQALADKLVSRLEVANALRSLPYRQKRVVELLYEEDRPASEVA